MSSDSPPGYGQLLRENPNLRRLWSGQVVSQMGDWFSGVAVAALLIERSGADPGVAVALYTFARHLPVFLLGPAAGIAADRLDRRRVLIAADLVRALLALGYLLVLAGGPTWLLYAFTAGLSGVSIFFNSSRSALLPTIAGRRQLMVANALSAATFGSTLAIGSLLGGLVSALVGRGPAFVLNALSFLASAAFISGIRVGVWGYGSMGVEEGRPHSHTPKPPYSHTPTLAAVVRALARDVAEGVRAVRRHPVLPGLLLLPAGWGLGTGAARVLYSLYGAHLGQQAMVGWVRHPRDFGIAILYAAMGSGALIGTFRARRLAGRPPAELIRAVSWAVLLDGLALSAFAFAGNLALAAVVLAAREVGYALWWTSQQTLVMLLAPDAVRGRVFAAQDSLTTLALLLSMLAAGPAIDHAGLNAVALVAGGMIVLAAGIFAVWARKAAAGAAGGGGE